MAAVALTSAVALLAGAGNSLGSRIALQQSCDSGGMFTAPIGVTLVAFLAMAGNALVPLLDYLRASPEQRQPLSLKHVTLQRYGVLLVPTAFDVVSTALQTAAFLFLSAGVSSALRASLLLFVMAACKLLRTQEAAVSRQELLGTLVSVMGASIVSLPSILHPSSDDSSSGSSVAPSLSQQQRAVLGVLLSLASNAVQGLQVAIETKYLQLGTFTADETNAVEGAMGAAMLGVLLLLFGVVPGASVVEPVAATWQCFTSTASVQSWLAALFILFLLSTTAFMRLSSLRGASYRALLMLARTVFVWLAELLLSAIPGVAAAYGHGWDGAYGWLEVGGFVLLVAGGAVSWAGQSKREAAAAEAVATAGSGSSIKLTFTEEDGVETQLLQAGGDD